MEIGLSRKTLLMSHAVCAKSNVCIKEGEKALAKHSSSAKHHKAKGAQAGTGNICQHFAQQDAKQQEQKSCEEKARDAELIYLHHIEAHGILPHVASCTTLLFKQMFPDSNIAEKFTFSDSKQGYEITHGLGQHYNTRLVNRLQDTFNAHMLIRNSVNSIGGCHTVKATITPEMRKAYVSAPARRKEFLEKRKADESKEAEVLAFNRRRRIKEIAGLHKYKLNELCKKLLADKAKIKDKLAEQTKQKKAEKTKQKKAKKRPLSGGSDHCATKKQKTS